MSESKKRFIGPSLPEEFRRRSADDSTVRSSITESSPKRRRIIGPNLPQSDYESYVFYFKKIENKIEKRIKTIMRMMNLKVMTMNAFLVQYCRHWIRIFALFQTYLIAIKLGYNALV